MNFLAHAYLAAPDDGLIAGGVIGDWIKGPLADQPLPKGLLRGVELHRAIDAFADREAAFRRSRARISAARRRWSGVLVDMYYDHLLAAHWEDWHNRPLYEFTQQIYASLERQVGHLPTPGSKDTPLIHTLVAVTQRMSSEDWLASYASVTGLNDILARMSQRARQPNPLANGAEELFAARADFAADFAEFLPVARQFAREWISRAPPSAASP